MLKTPQTIFSKSQILKISHPGPNSNSVTSSGKDPIIISDSPFPYEFELKSIQSFEKSYDGHGNYSYTGMIFKMRRNSLGQLLSGYYYPTGSFAILSLISFLINSDQVNYHLFFI